MLQIQQYVKSASLDEAYELLQKNRNNQILGGMIWLKMQERNIPIAIDCSDVLSDEIIEKEDGFLIGAMTSLRTLETHPALNAWCQNMLCDSVKDIVGVQLRNMATVGGSLYSRFGFSDVLCAFLALDTTVYFHHAGAVDIEKFANGYGERDILTHVFVKKEALKAAFRCIRKSATDLSVLNVAAVRTEKQYRITVGATPKCAKRYTFALSMTKEEIATSLKEKVECASNLRGSVQYRKELVYACVLKALAAIEEDSYAS